MKAFPSKKMVDGPNDMLVVRDEEGMDLRDYFAAAALESLIGDTTRWAMSSVELADRAYKVADAMMVERAK